MTEPSSTKGIFRVFYSGISISFFGSVVIGTIGLSAMQISITEGFRPALNFSIGSIVGELIYVRLLLKALVWIKRHKRLFKILEWVTVLIVIILAIASFKAAMGHHGAKNVFLSYTMHRFVLGFSMRALSPASIPFWLGWSALLQNKGILENKKGYYNGYLLGIAIGTFIAHSIFIFGGKLAVDKLDASQEAINFIIGCIFSVTAILQIWRIMEKRRRSRKLPKEEVIHP